jgi:hypothetical protein
MAVVKLRGRDGRPDPRGDGGNQYSVHGAIIKPEHHLDARADTKKTELSMLSRWRRLDEHMLIHEVAG